MTRRQLLVMGLLLGLLAMPVSAQDAKAVVAAASKAMGADR